MLLPIFGWTFFFFALFLCPVWRPFISGKSLNFSSWGALVLTIDQTPTKSHTRTHIAISENRTAVSLPGHWQKTVTFVNIFPRNADQFRTTTNGNGARWVEPTQNKGTYWTLFYAKNHSFPRLVPEEFGGRLQGTFRNYPYGIVRIISRRFF